MGTVLYTLATLVGGTAFLYRMRRGGSTLLAARSLVWLVLGGFLGANLGGALSAAARLVGGALPFTLKAYSILGGILGGAIAGAWVCRHYHIPFWRAADRGIPALPLALSIARLGCFVRGCCYGAPTTSWLGLYLPDHAGLWAVRYPTQLLSAAANLGIFLLLLTVERHAHPREGSVTRLFLGLFLLKRFTIEFLRGDALPPVLGPFNTTHLVCLVGLSIVTVISVQQRLKRKNDQQDDRAGQSPVSTTA